MLNEKKGISLIVLVLIAVVVIVIGAVSVVLVMNNSNNDNSPTNNNNNANLNLNNETSPTKPQTDDNQTNNIDLIYTFKDPSKPVAFDYPNLKSIEEGTSQIFKNSRYVIAYCRETKEAELKDIPTELSEKFSRTISTHLIGDFNSFSIKESKEMNINNIKVLMIKGLLVAEFDDGSKVNYPMQGYTFKKSGMIVELIGFINEETNDTNKKEMEKTIEAMIKTLRDDR